MKWASAISTEADLDVALLQVIGAVHAQLAGKPARLLLVFVASAHDGGPEDAALQGLPRRLCAAFPGARLVGCTGRGIAGGEREVEEGAALCLVAAWLPDVAVEAHHLLTERLPDPAAPAADWQGLAGLEPEHQPAFLLMADPFSFDTARLLDGLDRGFAGAPVLGGVASGHGSRPGSCALFLDDRVLRYGAVVLSLYGDIRVDALVAQGCRPVGAPLTITEAERNLIHTLDGQKVVPVLEALFSGMAPRDQALFRRSPMLGIALDRDRSRPRSGDFLIRTIQGVAQPSGALAVGALVHPGQVVQFHVRDATSAAQELRDLLTLHKRRPDYAPPQGVLMFTCLGRGEQFFGTPHHDTRAVHNILGSAPLGGFFGNGEIGPVHGQTFLHGFSSAFALFRSRGWS